MTLLILGLVILFGVHVVPFCPSLRARVVGRFGERAYRGVFCAVALVGLAVMIVGMMRAPTVHLWRPPAWGACAAVAAMAPAFILIAAANFRTHIKRRARHPMSLGILLWALAHIAANADAASLILFGAFAAFALVDIARPRAPATVASMPAPAAKWDIIAVVIGLAAYLVLAASHRVLFGVAVW